MASSLAQAAELVQRLPLQVEQLGQLLLAAVGVLDPLGQLALRGLDDLFLLAELLGLLFQGVLAFVEEALAFVQLAADLAKFFFAFGLLLELISLISSSASRRRFSTSCLALATISPASHSASLRRRWSKILIRRKAIPKAATAVKMMAMTSSVGVTTMYLAVPGPRRWRQPPRRPTGLDLRA